MPLSFRNRGKFLERLLQSLHDIDFDHNKGFDRIPNQNTTCYDINECESTKNTCHETAKCQNTEGSFDCNCVDEGNVNPGVACDCQKQEGWLGKNYQGTVAKTRTGKTCQKWALNTPHSHGSRFVHLPSNYCRNPDGEPEG